jgi:hypothetical protein
VKHSSYRYGAKISARLVTGITTIHSSTNLTIKSINISLTNEYPTNLNQIIHIDKFNHIFIHTDEYINLCLTDEYKYRAQGHTQIDTAFPSLNSTLCSGNLRARPSRSPSPEFPPFSPSALIPHHFFRFSFLLLSNKTQVAKPSLSHAVTSRAAKQAGIFVPPAPERLPFVLPPNDQAAVTIFFQPRTHIKTRHP